MGQETMAWTRIKQEERREGATACPFNAFVHLRKGARPPPWVSRSRIPAELCLTVFYAEPYPSYARVVSFSSLSFSEAFPKISIRSANLFMLLVIIGIVLISSLTHAKLRSKVRRQRESGKENHHSRTRLSNNAAQHGPSH